MDITTFDRLSLAEQMRVPFDEVPVKELRVRASARLKLFEATNAARERKQSGRSSK